MTHFSRLMAYRWSLAAVLIVMAWRGLGVITESQAADAWLGTWEIDLTQSRWNPGPPPQGGTFTAVSLGDGTQQHTYDGIAANGGKNHSERITRLDGAETPVAYTGSANYSSRTDTYRRIDSHSFEIVIRDKGRVVARTLTVVTPDGGTLTQTRTGATAAGALTTNVIVHTRRDRTRR